MTAFATDPGQAVRGVFPPEEVAQVKAIACELPKEHGLPLSRFSRAELHRLVLEGDAPLVAAHELAVCLDVTCLCALDEFDVAGFHRAIVGG